MISSVMPSILQYRVKLKGETHVCIKTAMNKRDEHQAESGKLGAEFRKHVYYIRIYFVNFFLLSNSIFIAGNYSMVPEYQPR